MSRGQRTGRTGDASRASLDSERGSTGARDGGSRPGLFEGGFFGGTFAGSRRGDFRGRRPKGYRRSDERIKEDVCEVLTDHPEIDAFGVVVEVESGVVVLSGTVPDRRQKRLVEDTVERVSGVDDVDNRLELES